jgi:HAD superfamily hydrolase (TIGR01509 family)
MPKIKAVIFDMDGVLVDAKDWHYEALNKALKMFGQEINRYDHLVTYDGLPTKKKLEMLSLENGLPRPLHGFINDMKQQFTMEMVFTKCKPIFYHQYALARLRKEDYKLAVASNSIRKTVEMMMEKAGLLQYFEILISNQDVVRPKPDPEMYNTAISRLRLRPEECLIVEDNENGIKAAVTSGAHLLKVNSINEVNYHNIVGRILQIENHKS